MRYLGQLSIFLSLAVATASAVFVPTTDPSVTLGEPGDRKEWRTLTKGEKVKYITAFKKLQSKPAIWLGADHPTVTSESNQIFSVVDQFAATYTAERASKFARGVPTFYPWHRVFLRYFERELQKIDPEVALPYWDWTVDTELGGKLSSSAVMSSDPETGFGGNSVLSSDGESYCVQDGAFAAAKGFCILRMEDDDATSKNLNSDTVEKAINAPTIESFAMEVDGPQYVTDIDMYQGEHIFIGLLHDSFDSNPNDPLFYIHHCFIDILWYAWQKKHQPSNILQ